MGLEVAAAPDLAEASAPEPEVPAQPVPPATEQKRIRTPKDDTQRKIAAERMWLSRQTKKIKLAKTDADRLKLVSEMSVRMGGPAEPQNHKPVIDPVSETTAVEPPRPAAVAVELVAEFLPLSEKLWQAVALLAPQLALARVLEREVVDPATKATKIIKVDPIEQLAQATAPVLAKYVPKVASGPEAILLGTIAMYVGPQLIEWVKSVAGAA